MTWLRALLFNLGFYLWTLALGILALPVLLGPRQWSMALGRFWAAGTMRILRWTVGLSWELRGAEHLPPGAAIVAMKHQSAWETIALPLIFGDPAVVLKRELLRVPFYGWYAGRASAIPVDRGAGAAALRRMVAAAAAPARDGRPIVIFPEGTRTAVGQRRPYHPGVAALYRQLGLPLVPVAVNSGLFWGRRAFLKRPGRIVAEILPAIPAGLDRRAALAELERRIEDATARLVEEGRAPSPSAVTGAAPPRRPRASSSGDRATGTE
jgi:1-acyl-sn-glycerol-3-phosphate acyltransferase